MSTEIEKYENRKKEIASMVLDSNSRVSVDALLVSILKSTGTSTGSII